MKTIATLIWLFIAPHFLYSQNSIASSGGQISGAGGNSSFTIGQLVYTTYGDSNRSLAQGVQQAFEIQTLTNNELLLTNSKIFVYPNPSKDNFVLEISENFQEKLEYTIYDVQGKNLIAGIIIDTKTQINTQQIQNGFYFLNVTKNKQLLKVIKIIKN